MRRLTRASPCVAPSPAAAAATLGQMKGAPRPARPPEKVTEGMMGDPVGEPFTYGQAKATYTYGRVLADAAYQNASRLGKVPVSSYTGLAVKGEAFIAANTPTRKF